MFVYPVLFSPHLTLLLGFITVFMPVLKDLLGLGLAASRTSTRPMVSFSPKGLYNVLCFASTTCPARKAVLSQQLVFGPSFYRGQIATLLFSPRCVGPYGPVESL